MYIYANPAFQGWLPYTASVFLRRGSYPGDSGRVISHHPELVSIYLTECQKCGVQYVGQTTRNFNARIREHINDIKNRKDTANANHYNSKGHSLSDFRAIIIERVVPNDTSFLLEREEMWIKRLETKRPHGLNKND